MPIWPKFESIWLSKTVASLVFFILAINVSLVQDTTPYAFYAEPSFYIE